MMKLLFQLILSVLMLALLNPARTGIPASPLHGPIHIEKGPVQPTWESMAEHYQVPDWFRDGKIGVWMHWGIPSAIDENRPNDGSHYGRRMYGPNEGETGGQLKMKDGRQGENHKNFSQQDIRFTTKDGVLYAFVLAPPTKDILIKTLASSGLLKEEISSIDLMGSNERIQWKCSPGELAIQLPKTLPAQPVVGFKLTIKKPSMN